MCDTFLSKPWAQAAWASTYPVLVHPGRQATINVMIWVIWDSETQWDTASWCFLMLVSSGCPLYLHFCCQVSPCFPHHSGKVVLIGLWWIVMTNMRLFFHVLHSVHSAVLAEAMTTLQLTSTATAFFVPLLAEEVANFMFPSYFHANRQRQFRILQLEAPCSRHACRPFWWPPAAFPHNIFPHLCRSCWMM